MSQTVHWAAVAPRPPDLPSGSLYMLKHLLWPKGERVRGSPPVEVKLGDATWHYLRGLCDGMPAGSTEEAGDYTELRRILDAVKEYGQVTLWIDE